MDSPPLSNHTPNTHSQFKMKQASPPGPWHGGRYLGAETQASEPRMCVDSRKVWDSPVLGPHLPMSLPWAAQVGFPDLVELYNLLWRKGPCPRKPQCNSREPGTYSMAHILTLASSSNTALGAFFKKLLQSVFGKVGNQYQPQ